MIPKQILDTVKEETKATEGEIELIFKSTFSLVVKLIRENKMKGIRLMGFGSFYVNPKKLNGIKKELVKKAFNEIE
jgi:nucleoid DNA-binding protein